MVIDQGKALVRVVATFRISHFTPGPAAAAVVEKFGFKTGRNWQKSRERKISLRFGGTCSNFQRDVGTFVAVPIDFCDQIFVSGGLP